ncbi:MAG: hypothetical protein JWO31_107 [Phycisphaerales bacterium]|nr:hypothetical protein [Phycisphaerales bacterium]
MVTNETDPSAVRQSPADPENDTTVFVNVGQADVRLPAEVSPRQAARILGVDYKTVMKYLDAGMLEWRSAGLPGSGRPTYRIKLASVLAKRNSYRATSPCPRAAFAKSAGPTGGGNGSRRPARTFPRSRHF